MITKPLLASAVEDILTLKYPILCTPKFDGIRCLKVGGHVVTRNFKPFPNVYIRNTLEVLLPNGMDGEVIIPGLPFNEISSACMRYEGAPADFQFHAFDYVSGKLDMPYDERMQALKSWYDMQDEPVKDIVKIILPYEIQDFVGLESLEAQYLNEGYEGVMIRSPKGKYKCGRSTCKEGILLKLKRFKDSEAKIIGFVEKQSNQNVAEKDAFGRTKRSTKKEGKVAAGTLGALIVVDVKSKVEFELGSGFDDKTRNEIWNNQKDYLDKLAKYKFQDVGTKDKPRFPIFLGIRDKRDM